MTARVGVLLHGPDDVAFAVGDLLETSDVRAVVAAAPRDPTTAALSLAGCDLAVGVAAHPGPLVSASHDTARQALHGSGIPYYAVETWHRHPAWTGAIAAAITTARARLREPDPHILFTAAGPGDPGAAAAAGAAAAPHAVWLREVAEEVSDDLGLTRRSIAWTGVGAAPTVGAALAALRQAGVERTVVRCPADPFDHAAGEVDAAARAHRLDVVHARVAADALVHALAGVVRTVVEHET